MLTRQAAWCQERPLSLLSGRVLWLSLSSCAPRPSRSVPPGRPTARAGLSKCSVPRRTAPGCRAGLRGTQTVPSSLQRQRPPNPSSWAPLHSTRHAAVGPAGALPPPLLFQEMKACCLSFHRTLIPKLGGVFWEELSFLRTRERLWRKCFRSRNISAKRTERNLP